MKGKLFAGLVSLSVGLALILSGCGGGGDSEDDGGGGGGGGGGGTTGGQLPPAGTPQPPNTGSDGTVNATGLTALNGGAAQARTGTFNIGDYIVPNVGVADFNSISGADNGGTFGRLAGIDADDKATARDDGQVVTLEPGQNTIYASIKRLSGGTLYPHWADFIVPAGYVATDFRCTALSCGTSPYGWPIPSFCINNNMGTPVYNYTGPHFSSSSAQQVPAYEGPVPLTQLVLAPLYRNTLARPYRVFVGGGEGAGVTLTCNVVAGTGGGNITLGSGKMQVTLTWDGPNAASIAQSDIDLHVLEPDGSHVFYSNTRGTTGNLDRDDTDGYGPENYFLTGNPATGTYTIYLNNYDSTPSVTALVRVKTLQTTRVFTVSWGATGPHLDKNIATVVFDGAGNATINDTTANPRLRDDKEVLPAK